MIVRLPDEQATLALGRRLCGVLQPGFVVFLRGNLGAGKTTLVRGFLRAAGYRGAVKSPTFTLVEEYALDALTVCHFDLYRVSSPDELAWFGFRDYLRDDTLCFIEWPERGGDELPTPNLAIELTVDPPGRVATIEAGPGQDPELFRDFPATDRDRMP